MNNLKSFVVCKVDAAKINIFLDGRHLSIKRECVDENILLGYVREFNATSDLKERERCWELISTMHRFWMSIRT